MEPTHDTAGPNALSRNLAEWWAQGLRTAFFVTPRWQGLRASPSVVAALIAVPWCLAILVERLYIVGAAVFYWRAFYLGWCSTAISAWVCWLLGRKTAHDESGQVFPGGAEWFAMLSAQSMAFLVVLGAIFVPLVRADALPKQEGLSGAGYWSFWIVPVLWMAMAQARLVWGGRGPVAVRLFAMTLLCGVLALSQVSPPPGYWYPSPSERDATELKRPAITQELWELQPDLLKERLRALRPERPGIVDVYAITFAPYSREDVFRRESELVEQVIAQRFDAEGRTLQLVNHLATVRDHPWATPLNLHRAILRAGELMNRDEDVLLIHLTSHGARDGVLSASFWPLEIEAVTPKLLTEWLDEAKIRYRIVSVSACYSGSWIEPLASAGTLVMTAADATHTSYGCGRGSPLTYFGRAMYDEQLRQTWSFEEAHANARKDIEKREREAGKSDGYSNPQIRIGSDIRSVLARLAAERAGSATR